MGYYFSFLPLRLHSALRIILSHSCFCFTPYFVFRRFVWLPFRVNFFHHPTAFGGTFSLFLFLLPFGPHQARQIIYIAHSARAHFGNPTACAPKPNFFFPPEISDAQPAMLAFGFTQRCVGGVGGGEACVMFLFPRCTHAHTNTHTHTRT